MGNNETKAGNPSVIDCISYDLASKEYIATRDDGRTLRTSSKYVGNALSYIAVTGRVEAYKVGSAHQRWSMLKQANPKVQKELGGTFKSERNPKNPRDWDYLFMDTDGNPKENGHSEELEQEIDHDLFPLPTGKEVVVTDPVIRSILTPLSSAQFVDIEAIYQQAKEADPKLTQQEFTSDAMRKVDVANKTVLQKNHMQLRTIDSPSPDDPDKKTVSGFELEYTNPYFLTTRPYKQVLFLTG